MKQSFSFHLLNISVLLLSSPILIGQVSLAPTSLYIHDQTGVASLYVTNNSNEDQEIVISLEFSYPGSDNNGNMKTISDDQTAATRYGITDYLRVFPKQFILKPGGQQTVRLQSKPLSDKPDGVYWTRVIVSSNTAAKDLGSLQAAEGIGTRINYVFKQNIPAFYIKGKATTGLIPGDISTSVEERKLVAVASLRPTGNSPFNGTVTARLIDNSGKEIMTHKQTIVAYSEVLRRIEMDLPDKGLNPGTYKLDLTYETVRADIPSYDLVQGAPAMQSVEVQVK